MPWSSSHQFLSLDRGNRVLTCLASTVLLGTGSKYVHAARRVMIHVIHPLTLSYVHRGHPGQKGTLTKTGTLMYTLKIFNLQRTRTTPNFHPLISCIKWWPILFMEPPMRGTLQTRTALSWYDEAQSVLVPQECVQRKESFSTLTSWSQVTPRYQMLLQTGFQEDGVCTTVIKAPLGIANSIWLTAVMFASGDWEDLSCRRKKKKKPTLCRAWKWVWIDKMKRHRRLADQWIIAVRQPGLV